MQIIIDFKDGELNINTTEANDVLQVVGVLEATKNMILNTRREDKIDIEENLEV